MKRFLFIILFFHLLFLLNGQGPEKIMNFHLRNASFDDFAASILKTSGVRIFYKEELVKNLKINLDTNNITVLSAVAKVIEGTNLRISTWNQELVIMPETRLITELPTYKQQITFDSTTEKTEQLPAAIGERYLPVRGPGLPRVITVGRRGEMTGKAKVNILGRVLDRETGEPLISVPVYITETKTGTLSDQNGFFNFNLSPGKYNVLTGYLGYAREQFLLEVFSAGDITVTLSKTIIQLQDVVISGESQTAIHVKDPGLDQITPQNIKSLPVLLGERDVIKASVTLPGIVSTEGGAGINVRGSASDQNAFYINRIPVYNTFHLFGFFSAFNPDIVSDFSIYKGHIPAEYGGRLASVFRITTRQGNRKHATVHGGISPVAGNVVLEGPIKKDTSSFIFSIRSTYSDWILSRIKDTTIRASTADFNDISGGISRDAGKTQLSIFAYHSKDHFRLADLNNYQYSNNGASVIINRTFSNSMRGELAFTGSSYRSSTADRLSPSAAYQHSSEIRQYEMLARSKHVLNDKNDLEYGADFSIYMLDRGAVLPYGDKSLLNIVGLGRERGAEGSLFIADQYEINSWLSLNAGLRYNEFVPFGPAKAYTYAPGVPVDTRYITDTLIFGKNKPVKWYPEPDIRAAVNIKTDKKGSVKLAFNSMHQNLFMLNTTIALSPDAQWKIADYHLRPSGSNQASFGVFRTFPEHWLEASVEAYIKKVINFPVFREGADFLKNPLVETSVLQGDQKAWGVEFFVKRSRRKLEGWLSYTYSRSFIKVNGEQSWKKINNGKRFPSDYDIPHSLNAVLSYYFTRRIVLSSDFTWQTGRPVTYPESVYYINGTPYLNYSERNAYRIPDYARLDLSLTIEGSLRADKLLHSSFVFNLYNATGRMNAYSVFFNTENGKIRSYKYSVIGVPVFTFTWQFKLGNYASE